MCTYQPEKRAKELPAGGRVTGNFYFGWSLTLLQRTRVTLVIRNCRNQSFLYKEECCSIVLAAPLCLQSLAEQTCGSRCFVSQAVPYDLAPGPRQAYLTEPTPPCPIASPGTQLRPSQTDPPPWPCLCLTEQDPVSGWHRSEWPLHSHISQWPR